MVKNFLTYARCLGEDKLGKKGQGMVEYALILAFVVVLAVVLTNAGGLQDAITGVFGRATNAVNAQ